VVSFKVAKRLGSWLIKIYSGLLIKIIDKVEDIIWLGGVIRKLFKLARYFYVRVYLTSLNL